MNAQTYLVFSGEELTIAEKIKRKRYQMLVHSYIYYELDKNIISDSKWSEWAVELANLQKQYPEIAKRVDYAEDFEDWDGSSGAFLTYADKPEIVNIARRLLQNVQPEEKPELPAPTKPKNQPLFAPTQSKPSTKKPAATKKKLF